MTYFVTFRLADSITAEKFLYWKQQREKWLAENPEPHTSEQKKAYHKRFSTMFEAWLDQGIGTCLLKIPECRRLVTATLKDDDGIRYSLGMFVVASNHVHALVTPNAHNEIADILQSWKSNTAKEIVKLKEPCDLMNDWWKDLHQRRKDAARRNPLERASELPFLRPVWQKENVEHKMRSEDSQKRYEEYIRNHHEWQDAAFTT
ncbi:hypothetical protein BH09SUM1_BH09SUM1_32860 [soil metagenome]